MLVLLLVVSYAHAAEYRFFGVTRVLQQPGPSARILPYSINLVSYEKMPDAAEMKTISRLHEDWLYFNKVEVKGTIYYRLVAGNYAKPAEARAALARFKKTFSGAWINKRNKLEKQQLASVIAGKKLPVPALKKRPPARLLKKLPAPIKVKPLKSRASSMTPKNKFAEKLLSQSRQLLLDRQYDQLIKVSNKVIEIGNAEQKQRAIQFEGLARERQRKFAQAVALYEKFLETYPKSHLARKIKLRLNALKTMNFEPRAKLAKRTKRKVDDGWSLTGSVSQYYRDNVTDTTDSGTDKINSSLISDLSLYARRRSKSSTTIIRFDGGLVNDFLDDSRSTNISRASVRYSSQASDFEVIGGRQSRTAKGVLGRFDGVVYKGLSHAEWDYSLYSGFPVQSSSDGFQSSRRFLGGSLSLNPLQKMDLDIYLVYQQNEGLVDRQAVGSELQYRSSKGFVFAIFDYDFFYDEINDITAITNYRYSNELTFNATLDYRNSPTLTTLNAIQGQSVATFEELKALYSDDEIYQFAADRTSKSKNMFLNVSYQIDRKHQLDSSLTIASVEASEASGGVEAAAASDDVSLSLNYTIDGYFLPEDYTTFGLRVSDTTSSHSLSLRGRARFRGVKSWRYDPSVQLDYRGSKTSGVNQWILKPKFKVKYKPTKKLSFEASIGIEYSNFDLPTIEDRTTYSLFIGYVYRI